MQVQETGQVSLPTLIHSFVARDRIRVSHAPAAVQWSGKIQGRLERVRVVSLETGVDTHTLIEMRTDVNAARRTAA